MKLLGYDGFSTDETAIAYYEDKGKLVSILWGHASEENPLNVINKLLAESKVDKLRESAILRTVANIRSQFGIK